MKLTPEEKAALTEPCVDLPLPEAVGLTKREYFAACALQGVIAGTAGQLFCWPPDVIAAKAVVMADALVAELAKK